MTKQTHILPAPVSSPTVPIDHLILRVRGERVILASDLATIYGVETRALNQAVKRNTDRFPDDFGFRLTVEEFQALRDEGHLTADGRAAIRSHAVILKSQTVISRWGGARRALPYAFTEHGAIMAANVLNSPQAVALSVYVVRAFVKQRETVAANQAILKRLAEIDSTLLQHDSALRDIYQKLRPLLDPSPEPPRRQIGFHAKPEA